MRKLFSMLGGPTPEKMGRELLGILTSETPDAAKAVDLIQKGAQLNLCDKSGNAAIHYAVRQNLTGVVTALAEAKADMNLPNGAAETPFTMLTGKILEAGAGASPALYAMAQLLAEKGADVDARDRQKRTPLLQAVAAGSEKLSRFLIDRKASLQAADAEGTTPLMAAVDREDLVFVQITLGAGARVLSKDILGESALAAARRKELDLQDQMNDIGKADPDYAGISARRENLRLIRRELVKAAQPHLPAPAPAAVKRSP